MIIKVLNRIIRKIKGEDFSLDPDLPIGYIIGFLYSQVIALLWGMIRLRTLKRVFISPSSEIRCPTKIKFGNNLRIGEKCYVNVLSKNGLTCGNNISIGYATHIELTGSLKHLGIGMTVGNNVGLGTHGHYGSGMGELTIGDDTIFEIM